MSNVKIKEALDAAVQAWGADQSPVVPVYGWAENWNTMVGDIVVKTHLMPLEELDLDKRPGFAEWAGVYQASVFALKPTAWAAAEQLAGTLAAALGVAHIPVHDGGQVEALQPIKTGPILDETKRRRHVPVSVDYAALIPIPAPAPAPPPAPAPQPPADTEEAYRQHLVYLISRTKSRGHSAYYNKFLNKCRDEAAARFPLGAAAANKKGVGVGFLAGIAAFFGSLFG